MISTEPTINRNGLGRTRGDTGTFKNHPDLVASRFIPCPMSRSGRIVLDRSASDPKHDSDEHQP